MIGDDGFCPACGEAMRSDYDRAPYCDNRYCKYYRRHYFSLRCPVCSKWGWKMLEGLQPPKTLYCKDHAAEKRQRAIDDLVRRAPILLHVKFVDDLILSPELAYRAFKQKKLMEKLRKGFN